MVQQASTWMEMEGSAVQCSAVGRWRVAVSGGNDGGERAAAAARAAPRFFPEYCCVVRGDRPGRAWRALCWQWQPAGDDEEGGGGASGKPNGSDDAAMQCDAEARRNAQLL